MKKYTILTLLGVFLLSIILFPKSYTPLAYAGTVQDSKVTVHLIEGEKPDTPHSSSEISQNNSQHKNLPKTGDAIESYGQIGIILIIISLLIGIIILKKQKAQEFRDKK